MKAVTTLTGHGGWPLSVFLTPDLKPFYGGTYFPPVPRHGLPGFPEVLNFIADTWKTKRQEVVQSSEEITKAISDGYALKERGRSRRLLLDNAYAVVLSAHDSQFGGFGRPPKFPLPSYLGFLLRYNARTGKGSALNPVMKTLDAMADGGIHDHLAGGFHRYSTDRYWLVPHFEKMLYDNALLARVYADAYRATRMQRYAATARDTLDWILEEMTSPEGGFFSARGRGHRRGRGLLLHLDPCRGLRGPREGGRRDLLRALRRLARRELRGRQVDPQRHRHRREDRQQARARPSSRSRRPSRGAGTPCSRRGGRGTARASTTRYSRPGTGSRSPASRAPTRRSRTRGTSRRRRGAPISS